MDSITVRAYREEDLPAMAAVWNQVVEEGDAFPQEECMSLEEARIFFASQTRSAVAVRESDGAVLGLYILHPNNVGRKLRRLGREPRPAHRGEARARLHRLRPGIRLSHSAIQRRGCRESPRQTAL